MSCVLFILLILTVLFNTAAQIVFKVGMLKIGTFTFTWNNLIPITLKVIASPWIISGMAIYVVSVGIWLMILSRIPVSIAYPMVSLGYITSAIAAYYLWDENLTLVRIAGMVIILIGVYLVAKN